MSLTLRYIYDMNKRGFCGILNILTLHCLLYLDGAVSQWFKQRVSYTFRIWIVEAKNIIMLSDCIAPAPAKNCRISV